MASGGPPGNPIQSTASESLYGELQDAGSLLQKAIVDPNQPCLIRPSTLTFKDLGHWNSEEFWEGPPDNVKDKVTSMLLSNDDLGYQLTSMSAGEDYWVGRTAPGVLFIEVMYRGPNSTEPHSSQIAQAVYQKDHPIKDLRYVFVVDIGNEETKHFIETQLYTDENGDFRRDRALRVWRYGTPEYQALIGTRIGKTVAYLVLGAFARGSRRISRIMTWYSAPDGADPGELQMRFDIENVPSR